MRNVRMEAVFFTEDQLDFVKDEAKSAGIDPGALIGAAALWALQFGGHAGDLWEYIKGASPGGYVDVKPDRRRDDEAPRR